MDSWPELRDIWIPFLRRWSGGAGAALFGAELRGRRARSVLAAVLAPSVSAQGAARRVEGSELGRVGGLTRG